MNRPSLIGSGETTAGAGERRRPNSRSPEAARGPRPSSIRWSRCLDRSNALGAGCAAAWVTTEILALVQRLSESVVLRNTPHPMINWRPSPGCRASFSWSGVGGAIPVRHD
jgi:hypothetical protein